MIELFSNQQKYPERNSSKGNQLKWEHERIWYKADYAGYEGLAEFMVSHLLQYSSLDQQEYILYELEQIRYKRQVYNGVKSENMLTADWQIITLERLFQNRYGQSLYQSLWRIKDATQRFDFLCETVQRMTGLTEFPVYMAKLLTMDAFFKNEDRHMHNIAVLMNAQGDFKLCPIFDNGGALLSDTRMDYPLGEDVYTLLDEVKAKTISSDFDEQLDVAEEICGETLHFTFTHKHIETLLQRAEGYSEAEKIRVQTILFEQMRRYKYLFHK